MGVVLAVFVGGVGIGVAILAAVLALRSTPVSDVPVDGNATSVVSDTASTSAAGDGGATCQGTGQYLVALPAPEGPVGLSEDGLARFDDRSDLPFKTLRGANQSLCSGHCGAEWEQLDLTVDVGDRVALVIYYSVDGDVAAQGTRVRLSAEVTSSSSVRVDAHVWAQNASAISDSFLIRVPDGSTITGLDYTRSASLWDTHGEETELLNDEDGRRIADPAGLDVGLTLPGTMSARFVVVQFCVDGDST